MVVRLWKIGDYANPATDESIKQFKEELNKAIADAKDPSLIDFVTYHNVVLECHHVNNIDDIKNIA